VSGVRCCARGQRRFRPRCGIGIPFSGMHSNSKTKLSSPELQIRGLHSSLKHEAAPVAPISNTKRFTPQSLLSFSGAALRPSGSSGRTRLSLSQRVPSAEEAKQRREHSKQAADMRQCGREKARAHRGPGVALYMLVAQERPQRLELLLPGGNQLARRHGVCVSMLLKAAPVRVRARHVASRASRRRSTPGTTHACPSVRPPART
jgi:hypothetical protein